MSLTSHLTELRKKHSALSRQVEEGARNPASDTIELAQMKKRKLVLKTEIEKLSATRH